MQTLYRDLLSHVAGFLTLNEKLNSLLMIRPEQTKPLRIQWIQAELDCLYLREWTTDLIETDNAKLAFRLMPMPPFKHGKCARCQVRDLACPHRDMDYPRWKPPERQRAVNRIMGTFDAEQRQWLQLAMERAITVQVAKKSH